ncbi:MAG: anti-sigma regulatory factor [Lachnospiraceae bacterium]|nr:anti-sigma regulatory factor [Lachnospiraceae bacterium]MCR5082519.1 ATP-binding protein [Parasporobacterium sp.]
MENDALELDFEVDGNDYQRAGEASSRVKTTLKEVGMPAELIKRVAIAMYEGEINMVIHADSGVAKVFIKPDGVEVVLKDVGKGIPDVEKAMQEGFSTASDDAIELGFGAGMGLPNMKKHSDEMVIDTEVGVGTTVTMKFFTKE